MLSETDLGTHDCSLLMRVCTGTEASTLCMASVLLSPTEEEGVLCPAGHLTHALACQVHHFCGAGLVPECARAQLPTAVASPCKHLGNNKEVLMP